MGFMGSILGNKEKQNAFYSDALILSDISPACQDNEKIVHFVILPDKKQKNLFSLMMMDGKEPRELEANLSLQAALMLMKKRFELKRQALNTLAQTLGTHVQIDDKRLPCVGSFKWLHVREIFNFVAEDVPPDVIH